MALGADHARNGHRAIDPKPNHTASVDRTEQSRTFQPTRGCRPLDCPHKAVGTRDRQTKAANTKLTLLCQQSSKSTPTSPAQSHSLWRAFLYDTQKERFVQSCELNAKCQYQWYNGDTTIIWRRHGESV